jgi:hypothetical protein
VSCTLILERWRQKRIFEGSTSNVLGEAEDGNQKADSTYRKELGLNLANCK